MDVTLSPNSEKFVQQKLSVGDFDSANAIVNEGLRLLQEQDERWKNEVRQKVAEAREQMKAGQGLTPEQLEKKLAARKAKWKAEHGLA